MKFPKITLLFVSLSLFVAGSVLSQGGLTDLLDALSLEEYEGRGLGTQGLEKARDLLVKTLSQEAFTPGFLGAPDAQGQRSRTYTQSLRVFVGNELGPDNYIYREEGSRWGVSSDFVPLAFSRSGKLQGQGLVFVGYGISLRSGEATQYDDYAGLDVKGKVVVALLGDPAIGNKDSLFRSPAFHHYSTLMYKVQNAELHGAAGIIIVRDPLSYALENPLVFLPRQGGGSSSTLLAAQMRHEAASQLLGVSLKEKQQEIADTQTPASFEVNQAKISLAIDMRRQLGNAENVAAWIPGLDPSKQNEVIVIGAHYDHLGFGGDSSMDPDGAGKIHPGADDNASGTQAVMNLARKIRAEGKNQRPVLALFFSAEEVGLLGSKHFLESIALPEGAKVVAMINLDMVGRMEKEKLSVLALRSALEFPAIVEEVNQEFGLTLLKGDSGFGSSDHASFLQMKIPSLFFTTGAHRDYHRPSDTAEKINRAGLQTVEAFAYRFWEKIDALSAPPTYDPSSEDTNQPSRPDRGYGVYFGSIPEFNQGDVVGVLLQGVRPDSPAARAGLQGGDILTGMGEIEVKNLYDFVFALRFYRPNEEVEIRWTRAGQSYSARTVLLARQ